MGKPTPVKNKKPEPKSRPTGSEVQAKVQAEAKGLALVKPDNNILNSLLSDAGKGMDSMVAEDYAIPRLTILQDLSPQTKFTKAEYVEGAEPGMIYNNVSGEVYDGQEGLLAVFVSYRRTNLQWWPRNSKAGKGFIKDHGLAFDLAKTMRDDKGANMLPDGSEIVPTAEYFCFIIKDEQQGDIERVLVSMAKSQLAKAKRLNTLASSLLIEVNGQKRQAPLFIRAYHLRTGIQENKNGDQWFGWDIQPAAALIPGVLRGVEETLPYGEKVYMEASAFYSKVQKGEVKVSAPVEHDTPPSGDDAPM